MRHFKLYKKLTLGQKIIALVLILNISLVLNFTPTAWAQDAATETPPSVVVNVPTSPETAIAGSCEAIEADLNTRLRAMATACSSTNLGRACLQGLFRCDEASDGEGCEDLNSVTSSPATETERRRLEDQREELKELNDQRKELQDKQEEAQRTVDELNEKYEDKMSEVAAADEELRSELRSNDAGTQAKLTEIQTNIRSLEEANNALFGRLAEQQTQMIQFMTAERLACNQQSQQHAQNFYTRIRSCSTGRGNCRLSLGTVITKKSPAEMAQAYGRRKRRECLRTDGENDFAIKYRAMDALIRNQEGQIANQQRQIAKNRGDLVNEIQVAQAAGQIANAEANLRRAERVQTLSTEKNRIQAQIVAQNATIRQYSENVNALQERIEAQSVIISNTRRSITSSMSSGILNLLRESQLLASSLLTQAQDARTGTNSCPCSGAIQNISELSGSDFCSPRNAPAQEDEAVYLIDAIIE
jgi:DNA repair exonuclease SbcCD ATPase subunit